jgi:excisionase family DNA binding protein
MQENLTIDFSNLLKEIKSIVAERVCVYQNSKCIPKDCSIDLLTVKQVCESLRISRGSLYKLLQKEVIPSIHLQGKRLFRKQVIYDYLISLESITTTVNIQKCQTS